MCDENGRGKQQEVIKCISREYQNTVMESAPWLTLLLEFTCPPTERICLYTQNARHESKGRPNSRYQQVLIVAGLHVVSCDFSG